MAKPQMQNQADPQLAQLFIHQAADPIFWVDSNAQIVYANKATCLKLGYSIEELLALKLYDLDPNYTAQNWPHQWESLKQLGSITAKSSYRIKTGNSLPLKTTSNYIIFNDTDFNCIFARRITNDQETEEALEKQRAFLRQVLDINPHLIFARDSSGRFTLANETFAKLYHTTVEEILGKTDADFNLDPQLVQQSRRDDLTVMSSLQEIYIPERQIQTDAQEKLWWQIIKRPIVDENGIANQVLGVVTDITDRKLAEEALKASEERLHHVIASISGHIYVTEFTITGEHLRTYISPNAESLTGYPIEKFTNDWYFWQSLIHPDDKDKAAGQVANFIQGENSEVEYRLIRPNGEVMWVRDSGRVEKTVDEQSLIIYGFVTDITAWKRVEEALRLARDQALEANALKTQLLAKVSHELRTPLGAILGFTEMLEAGIYGPVSERQQKALAEVIESSYYLTNLVSELLDQAQLEAGKSKLNNVMFVPKEMIDQVYSKMNVLAQAKSLTLTTHITPELPDYLWGDPARIQQILVNLVSNAIKFTQMGSIDIRLYCPDQEHWAIVVADTGVGIPSEARNFIFEPFRQVDGSTTREHPGTGLGLSIVKQLATLMDGRVSLESNVGHGSKFTVAFPLQTTDENIYGSK